ncbi:MAG: polysaccharide biosynthesis protein [Trueperella sp.]|nr:polysaccharide biosynthesis protein [Trueperella sp.]
MFRNKTLLITGGTGSFGNAVLSRFLESDIAEIRIFSRDEKKQDDMRRHLQDNRVRFYIGDVRDYDSVHQSMVGVDYVFHAAALKQVPSCEFYPMEAVKTNIMGTDNVIQAAVANGVERVICLSTDKAVYPINAMGMSKALMEKVAVARSRTSGDTTIVATRYGNVMASRGSVIPLFIEQIKSGRPMTVTDPNMTRFMMTLDDAVDLVLFAFNNGNSGDIFVQKAPASTIGDLAISLQALFKVNTPIEVIGVRHGEKLYETLMTREEMVRAEDLGRYFRIPPDNRDLNYEKYFSQGHLQAAATSNGQGPSTDLSEDYNSHNTYRLTVDELKELLLKVDYVRSELEQAGKLDERGRSL